MEGAQRHEQRWGGCVQYDILISVSLFSFASVAQDSRTRILYTRLYRDASFLANMQVSKSSGFMFGT